MSEVTSYTCGCQTVLNPPPDDCPTGYHTGATQINPGGNPMDHGGPYNTQCGCGKFKCKPENCDHLTRNMGDPDKPPPQMNDFRGPLPHPHHTDGTQACEANHRTPEQQAEWEVNHSKWREAQARLPDLAAVMSLLYDQANPLSFDGHDNFTFVSENPEAAAICIHHMYDTLARIAVGKTAMAEIPVRSGRDK